MGMRLIDADALMQVFSKRPPDYYSTCYIASEIATAPTVGGWISVKDRLPEEETLVVALVQYEVGWYRAFAWRDKRGWQSSQEEFSGGDGDYITHWMPLPGLPKEENE